MRLQFSTRIPIFESMRQIDPANVLIENVSIRSTFLDRQVIIDFYLPGNARATDGMGLLLINDGQNMEELGLAMILQKLYHEKLVRPLLCVGIHTGPQRKMEYGVASMADYLGRGARAGH